jgi:hypothetical protein
MHRWTDMTVDSERHRDITVTQPLGDGFGIDTIEVAAVSRRA